MDATVAIDEGDSLDERIRKVVASIPRGKVLTYGAVAVLAGRPGRSRRVGAVLRGLPDGSDLPWFRVVNHRGGISLPEGSEDYQRQRRLLAKEGIALRENGTLELARHLWWPDEEPPADASKKKKRRV